ncbi:MAG: PAS domain S-box protein [Bacteroidetes bacterium]|nr:PAS domain S-box protein [Bacteroidota bacterium]
MNSEKENPRLKGVIEIMSYAGICGVFADGRGRIVGSTPRFIEISGDGVPNKNLSEVFLNSPDLSSLASGKETEFTLINSGRQVYGKVISSISEDNILGIVFQDFTERTIRSIPQLAQMVRAGNDLIFQFNKDGRVYYVSGNVEEITGYSQDDFLTGKLQPLDIVHREDKKRLEEEFKTIFSNHAAVENSLHRIIKRNGEITYLIESWHPLLDTDGKFTGVISLNKDITSEKLLQSRLELFRSAFEHSTDAIIITTVDGKIVDVNDAFTKIYGYSREDAIGKSTALVQSRHSTQEFYSQMWDSLQKYDNWKGEIINRRKDGLEIPIWLSITPIYLDGAKIGYMGIESDISERKNLEQQIIQTEKLATTGQLAAGIAHEIGTPLNIISGNAEFMLLDMNESDTGYRELSIIIEQTKRISQLMRQLLDFARPKMLSLQAVDINGVIHEVLDFVRLQFKKSSISTTEVLGQDIPRVYGDPALLYQVFLNIVVNSFQAMKQGGELHLQTGIDRKEAGKERVVVTIQDTGEGIQPGNLDKLFTPFFTTKEPGKGTGLGLALTRRIVQEHGGEIEIASEVGKGTVVTIWFKAFQPRKQTKE